MCRDLEGYGVQGSGFVGGLESFGFRFYRGRSVDLELGDDWVKAHIDIESWGFARLRAWAVS